MHRTASFLWQGIVGGCLLGITLLAVEEKLRQLPVRRELHRARGASAGSRRNGWIGLSVVSSRWQNPVRDGSNRQHSWSPFSEGHQSYSPRNLTPEAWILPIWAVGVFLFALRLAWAGGHASSLRRHGHTGGCQSIGWADLAERSAFDASSSADVVDCGSAKRGRMDSRPVILLPAAVVVGLTPQQLEALLAHELAHIRRHDYFVNILQMIVETFLFYHPVVWWVSVAHSLRARAVL